MALTNLTANGTDYTASVADYSFPTASPDSWGGNLMDTLSPISPPERALSDAPWSVTLQPVNMANQAAVSAFFEQACADFGPGMAVLIQEDDCLACTATLKHSTPGAQTCYETWGVMPITGTRWPLWEGRSHAFTLKNADGDAYVESFGTAAVVDTNGDPITVRGNAEARVAMSVQPSATSSMNAVGFHFGSVTGYDPIDFWGSSAGVSDSDAVSKSAGATGTGTWRGANHTPAATSASPSSYSAPAFAIAANRGAHRVLCRCRRGTAGTYVRASSAVVDGTATVSETGRDVAVLSSSLHTRDLGTVRVPVSDVGSSTYATAETGLQAWGGDDFSVDAVARVPVSDFGIIVGSELTSARYLYIDSAERIARVKTSSGTSVALDSTQVLGIRPGFIPSSLVTAVYAGDNHGHATITGTITERWLDRARAL